MIINRRFLGSQVLEVKPEADNPEHLSDDISLQSGTGNIVSKEEARTQDVSGVATGNEEFNDIPEKPSKSGRPRSALSWIKTELLLLQLNETNRSDCEQEDITDGEAEEEDEVGGNDHKGIDEDNPSDLEEEKSSSHDSDNVPLPDFESAMKLLADSVSELGLFGRSSKPFDPFFESSEFRLAEENRDHALAKIIGIYTRLFHHLVSLMVFPCDGKLTELVREILILRRIEGELLSVGLGTGNEISIISEQLQERSENIGSYWRERLMACGSVLSDLIAKYEQAHADLGRLVVEFGPRFSEISQFLCSISSVASHSLYLYDKFNELNGWEYVTPFGSANEVTQVSEFRMRTLWHRGIDVEELHVLLNENINALVATHDLVGKVIERIHDNLVKIGKGEKLDLPVELTAELMDKSLAKGVLDSKLENNLTDAVEGATHDGFNNGKHRKRKRSMSKRNRRKKQKG